MARSQEAHYLTHLPPPELHGQTARLFQILREMPDQSELSPAARLAMHGARAARALAISFALVALALTMMLGTVMYLGPANTPGHVRVQLTPSAAAADMPVHPKLAKSQQR